MASIILIGGGAWLNTVYADVQELKLKQVKQEEKIEWIYRWVKELRDAVIIKTEVKHTQEVV